MPKSPNTKAAIKEIIVACLAAGISFQRMQQGGLASVQTIRNWKNADPNFAQRCDGIAAENRMGKSKHDWGEVKRLLHSGYSIKKLRKNFPQMPCETQIGKYASDHPEWGASLKLVYDEQRSDNRRRLVGRKEKVLKLLANGSSIADLQTGGVVSRNIISRWRARDAAFDAGVREHIAQRKARATEARNAEIEVQRTERLVAAELARQRALKRRRVTIDPICTAAEDAIPRSYPRDVRDDIKSEIVLAVLEGRVKLDQIAKQAKRFITGYWRGRPDYHAQSFDARIGANGGRLSLHEIIAHR